MAIRARLVSQMPFVGTKTQAEVINAVAERYSISKAEVLRDAINYVYGLRGGELPTGATVDSVVAFGQDRLSGSTTS